MESRDVCFVVYLLGGSKGSLLIFGVGPLCDLIVTLWGSMMSSFFLGGGGGLLVCIQFFSMKVGVLSNKKGCNKCSHHPSWSDVCLHKDFRGLGLGKLPEKNTALRAKRMRNFCWRAKGGSILLMV